MKLGFEKFNRRESVKENLDYEVFVNDTSYQIHLLKSGKCSYEITFSAENTGLVTNKGIKQFYLLVEEIKKIIENLQKTEAIKEITFCASAEYRNLDTILEIQKKMQEKFKTDNHCFDGFSFEDDQEKIFIDNKTLFFNLKLYHSKLERVLGKTRKEMKNEINIEEIVDNVSEVEHYFSNSTCLSQLLEYAQISISEELSNQINSDFDNKKAEQRNLLYKRVLERNFPEVKYTFDEKQFKLYFDN